MDGLTYIYIYLVDVKNALSVFPKIFARTFFLRFFARTFFPTVCISVFSSTFSSFVCFYLFLYNFPTNFILAGQYWKAAELRPPGGLQAGGSEVAFLCPNVVSTFF